MSSQIIWDCFSKEFFCINSQLDRFHINQRFLLGCQNWGCRDGEHYFPVFWLLCQCLPVGAPAHIPQFQLKEYLNLKTDVSEIIAYFLHCCTRLYFFVSQNIKIPSCFLPVSQGIIL